MHVFTKTCARDAERVAYQIRAVARRCVPLLVVGRALPRHTVCVERAEVDAIRQALISIDPANPPIPRCEIVAVEDHLPEAMDIPDPYLRQQYIKIVAPTIWGAMLQLDSDMCPIAGESRWLPREWFFRREPQKHRLGIVVEWVALYEALLGGTAPAYDFMGPMKGWYITRELAAAFRMMAEVKQDTELHRVFVYGGGGHVPLGTATDGFSSYRMSEYHLLGTFAHKFFRSEYRWVDGEQPAWCHHFTSAEPLSPQQRELLEKEAFG